MTMSMTTTAAPTQQRRASAKMATVAVKSAGSAAAVAAPRRRSANATATSAPAAGATAASTESAPQRRRRKCRVSVDISACRYAIIRKCLRERDFRLVKKGAEPSGTLLPSKWDIWWSDRGDLLRDLPRLSPFQKVNHFPSMEEICRKDFLANNLNAIFKVLPSEFDFFPRSFLVPAEGVDLRSAMESGPKNATYIVKPRTLCQGKGISLIQSYANLPLHEPCVVQRYIDNPLLIDGLKFDLRVYVLVYSVHPLKIYIFRNGLARFCTMPFQKPTKKNLSKKRMHLTNYAINKRSKDFQQATTHDGEGQASKRSLTSVMEYLDDSGRCSSARVWDQICDIVVKTLLCVEPKLQSSYKSYFGANEAAEAQWGPKCFEILGFDVMLDAAGKAWLFEVNHAPSFAGDSPLDREVKTALIASTLDIVGVTNEKKLQFMRQQRHEWTKRLWSTTSQTQPKSGREGGNQAPAEPANVPASTAIHAKSDGLALSTPSGSDSDDTQEDEVGDLEKSETSVLAPGGGHDKPSLKNVIFRRNRVIPTAERFESAPFGNEYSLLYPTERMDSNRFVTIRDAAQVNKSKLWN